MTITGLSSFSNLIRIGCRFEEFRREVRSLVATRNEQRHDGRIALSLAVSVTILDK